MNNNQSNQIEDKNTEYTELSDLELESVSGGKGGRDQEPRRRRGSGGGGVRG
ncbi:MAG: bacteriocin [Crocosphaera sp.]